MASPSLPFEAVVVERLQESPTIFTLRLRFTDPRQHAAYRFAPGQFNMLSLPGVGEVPISIVSDPADEALFDHTIRAVGRVTNAMSRLIAGDRLGIRGPYGHGWPLAEAEGQDIVIITGGLGCAPTVAAIRYILRRRQRYGRLTLIQGVRHSDDLIWREQYERWMNEPDTRVLLAATEAGPWWPWHRGRVTEVFEQLEIQPERSMAMMCGPEGMMIAGAKALLAKRMTAGSLWVSLERNMQCATGHCGHCQLGPYFVCHDGPVFRYSDVAELMSVKGL